jgi:hypothetical protein
MPILPRIDLQPRAMIDMKEDLASRNISRARQPAAVLSR